MLNIRNLKIYNLRFQIQHFRMIILKKMKIINCFLKNNWHTNKTSIIYKIYFFNFYFMSWPHSPGEMSQFIPKIEEVWWVPSQAEWQKGKANPYSLRFHQDNPDMTVSAIRDKVEWVFGLWYEQWEDWNVYYIFTPEYHVPHKVVVWEYKFQSIKDINEVKFQIWINWNSHWLMLADKDTFRVLWWWYAVDKKFAFFKWKILKFKRCVWVDDTWKNIYTYVSLNPETFESITLDESNWWNLYNSFWIFWDLINNKVIVNWEVLEWINLDELWYSEDLRCWTDWKTAIRTNYVVNKLTDREKQLFRWLIFPKP